jgi:hypothetical protein
MKLEQRSRKCVELRGGTCKYIFFNPVTFCFVYKAKDLLAILVHCVKLNVKGCLTCEVNVKRDDKLRIHGTEGQQAASCFGCFYPVNR